MSARASSSTEVRKPKKSRKTTVEQVSPSEDEEVNKNKRHRKDKREWEGV